MVGEEGEGRDRRLGRRRHRAGGDDRRGGATARKVAFLIVKRRDAETLTNFIVDRVWGGSILISDSWRGYTAFLQRMYTHCVVNHSVEDGKTAVVGGVTIHINTNHIEESWWRFGRRSVGSLRNIPCG